MLDVRVLGGFEVRLDGKPVRIARSHGQKLLACLMLERGQALSREQLAELLWQDGAVSDPLEQLRNVLMKLERSLQSKDTILRPQDRLLAFNIAMPHRLDAATLLACENIPLDAQPTDELLRIASAYQPFAPEFDGDWAQMQRSRLERIYEERVLRTLPARLASERRWRLAAEWGRRAVACAPNIGFEPLYAGLMRAEYQLHNPKGVSEVYEQLQAALDEMGLVPTKPTRDLYERMLRDEEPFLAEAEAAPPTVPPFTTTPVPARTAAPPTVRLPDYLLNPPTPLIGRAHLLKRVVGDLADPRRQLVTLLGIGGIGKTRLAAAAAIEAARHYPDGVHFVEADAARTPDGFYAALAESVRFTPYGQSSLKSQVLDYLREKTLLLLLDNFETLLEQDADSAALIEEMCVKAPGVTVLVTTRQSLQLLRETVFDVDGLDVPASADQPDAISHGAVELFGEIAGRVNDAFDLGRELPAVVRICRMVGGTPLAIEIAAALVRGMSCEQIAARIQANLDALISTWRNVPPRQRSLRAVLEYAHGLLTPGERGAFAQASVFVAGFTQAAAGEVAGATHSNLRALKDCALLRQDAAARFFMHSFVRQFSGEKLAASDSNDAAQARMTGYFLGYARDNAESIPALEPEWANLLEGMRLAHARAAWPDALAYADALCEPWYTAARYGDIRQGMAWACEAAEALKDEKAQSRFLSHWGRACVRQGDYAEADGHFERGLALAWRLIDSPSIARVLYERAQLKIERSELADADRLLDECMEIYEELNDNLGMAETLRQKARTDWALANYRECLQWATKAYEAYRLTTPSVKWLPILRLLADTTHILGDHVAAQQYLAVAIKLSTDSPNERERALLEYSRCGMLGREGRYREAMAAGNLSRTLLRQIGDRKSIAHVTNSLGYLHVELGDDMAALSALEQGTTILRELQDGTSLVIPLLKTGDIQAKLGNIESARNAYSEGLRLAQRAHHPAESDLSVRLDKLAGTTRLDV